MCGRYYVDGKIENEIGMMVGGIDKIDEQWQMVRQGYDVHPADLAPVLMGDYGRLVASWKRWEYPRFEGKQVIFNARAESVMEKRLFSNGIYHQRIVIPGTWFYEWNQSKEKYAFLRPDSAVLYMAGFMIDLVMRIGLRF